MIAVPLLQEQTGCPERGNQVAFAAAGDQIREFRDARTAAAPILFSAMREADAPRIAAMMR
jgi:hypothetical protein